ncbi:GerW family sporulation protein [Schaedlerella sp.]|uniref:GerW family sporulation protein n=1 Tax=Schaedlerella sp. TaxID=2676057 RepID=UPI0037464225
MSETKNLNTTVESLMKGMDGLVSSKTVVGDAVRVDNITILPLIDVSFGIGAGSNLSDKKDKGMGGVGGKITPSAVLVIKDGTTRLVNIKNQDTITKLFDLVPEVLDKITTRKEDKVTEEDVADILDAAADLEE